MTASREFDFALMEKVVQAKLFTRQELCSMNRCRLYLQAFYLSDIVSENGRKILNEAFDGNTLSQRQKQVAVALSNATATKRLEALAHCYKRNMD